MKIDMKTCVNVHYLDNTLKICTNENFNNFFLCLNLNSGLFALYMFMHFSGFENWGVGVAKLTLNLQFDCFVTLFIQTKGNESLASIG
jgi:hypothetical protein